MSIPVFEVDTVYLSIQKSHPPQLHVSAVGKVTSGGWKAPGLESRIYITPPADGILDMDFVATPPSGPAIQVILPVAADITVSFLPWIKGVRVHAKRNSVVASVLDEASHREIALAKLD